MDHSPKLAHTLVHSCRVLFEMADKPMYIRHISMPSNMIRCWMLGYRCMGMARRVKRQDCKIQKLATENFLRAAGAAGLQKPGLMQTVEETNLITKKQCPLIF